MDERQAPLANLITLGARDLPLLRDFYRRLGWPQIEDDDDFAVFELRGALLALFPVDMLAADGRREPESGHGGIRFTLGVMVDSAQAVDEMTALMRQAGGRVTKEPVDAEFFEGRSAYVADPEGNYWEIAWAGGDNAVVDAAHRAAGMTNPAESHESGK
jgi:catechol 2,3-dioxygenase-like lactoylglutathione lyase family enzyme